MFNFSVVNRSQVFTFALAITTPPRDGRRQRRCESLSNLYLCSCDYNALGHKITYRLVVNRSQIFTFALAITT